MSGPLSAEAPVGMLVVNALAKGASRLHGAILMVEKDEDDAIHQVRVACRRLRSDLKLFRKLLAGDWARQLRADLAALALACGEARDLEVIAALVGETVSSEDDQDHVDTILTTLTLGLERAAARSAEVPELLNTANRTFTLEADKLKPWTPDDDWHEVRLLAKRVRYAADTSAAVLGDEAKATASQAAKYQELLGQHQDHCAAADALIAMATDAAAQDDPELSFTLGRLTERHRAARKPLREEFLSLYHRP